MREIYRYLGYGTVVPDDTITTMIEEVLTKLMQVITPKSIYKLYHCKTSDGQVILTSIDKSLDSSSMVVESKNLSDNLCSCQTVAVLAATLGIGADKLIQKYECINMAKASIAQACGAACIESYCDRMQEVICDALLAATKETYYVRPRFSPGYGDLALENQIILFDALECTKRIGLTLTDSLLMYPTKSVTAFIGLTNSYQKRVIDKCERCGYCSDGVDT